MILPDQELSTLASINQGVADYFSFTKAELYQAFLNDRFFCFQLEKIADLSLVSALWTFFLQIDHQISFLIILYLQSYKSLLQIMDKPSIQTQNDNLEELIQKIKKQNLYLIGICGVPGAGKSTLSQIISAHLTDSIIVPMDGFHLYRKDLDQQGIMRRGALFTFNLKLFKQRILRLKQKKAFPIYFPSFDHEQKDPKQNSIIVNQSIKHIIVQGLYIFDKSLELEGQWNMKIFISQSIEDCVPRLQKRCIQKKIQTQQEKVRQRIENDKLNGKWVMQNTNFTDCLFVKNPNNQNLCKQSLKIQTQF